MDALQRLHKGIVFQSLDGAKQVGWPIDGIVDDTTVGTNTTGDHETILEEAQVLAQNWADLLWMSGGSWTPQVLLLSHHMDMEQWKTRDEQVQYVTSHPNMPL